MNTKYGEISTASYDEYCKSLINRIWILIPFREEKCATLKQKIERLNRELCGMTKIVPQSSANIITIIHLLENLITEKDFQVYRADVLRCCELMKHIGGDVNV